MLTTKGPISWHDTSNHQISLSYMQRENKKWVIMSGYAKSYQNEKDSIGGQRAVGRA